MSRFVPFCCIVLILLAGSGCLSTPPEETAAVQVVDSPAAVTTLQEEPNLIVENTTPYEIVHLYLSGPQEEAERDLLEYYPIDPESISELTVPGGVYWLRAEIAVGEQLYTVEEQLNFEEGQKFFWQIELPVWVGSETTYAYLDGGYGYLDPYAYLEW